MQLDPPILELADVQDEVVSQFLARTLQEPAEKPQSRFQVAEQSSVDLHPHDFLQYCELSLHLSDENLDRPVYIGYAVVPHSPLGVCR